MNRPSTAEQSLNVVLAGRDQNSIEQCGTSTFQEVVGGYDKLPLAGTTLLLRQPMVTTVAPAL
jgi:hypothetical protein